MGFMDRYGKAQDLNLRALQARSLVDDLRRERKQQAAGDAAASKLGQIKASGGTVSDFFKEPEFAGLPLEAQRALMTEAARRKEAASLQAERERRAAADTAQQEDIATLARQEALAGGEGPTIENAARMEALGAAGRLDPGGLADRAYERMYPEGEGPSQWTPLAGGKGFYRQVGDTVETLDMPDDGTAPEDWTKPEEMYDDEGRLRFGQFSGGGDVRFLEGAMPTGTGKIGRAIQGEKAAVSAVERALEQGMSTEEASRELELRARELFKSTTDFKYQEVPNADGTSTYYSYDPFSGEKLELFRGERSLVPDSVRNRAAQTIVDRGEARMALQVVKKTYKPKYLSFQNRAMEWYKKPLHKLSPESDAEEIAEIEKGLTEDQRQESREYWQWRGMVQRNFDIYRKKITGAQAALAELDRLQENFLSGKMSDPQFRGNLDSIMELSNAESKFNRIVVEQNRYPTDEEIDTFAETMYQTMADMTYEDARKKAKGIADDAGGDKPSTGKPKSYKNLWE